jgi:hypothetical protein
MRLMRLIACASLTLLLGCSGSGSGTDGPAPDMASSAPVDGGADAAGGGDTWSNFAQGWFKMYCVECHSPGGQDPMTGAKNFTQYASVMQFSLEIRCGVSVSQDPTWACGSFPAPKQFPICDTNCTNPMPTDSARTELVNWISAGLPQ